MEIFRNVYKDGERISDDNTEPHYSSRTARLAFLQQQTSRRGRHVALHRTSKTNFRTFALRVIAYVDGETLFLINSAT